MTLAGRLSGLSAFNPDMWRLTDQIPSPRLDKKIMEEKG